MSPARRADLLLWFEREAGRPLTLPEGPITDFVTRQETRRGV